MTIHSKRTPEFEKDLKHLSKKYRSLPDDLDLFLRVVSIQPLGEGKHFNIITKQGAITIVKARLFCQTLKGSSLRIIYAYTEQTHEIEFVSIEFIELYFKGDKENEDSERIREYLSSH
jgi:mRNA-degrading endonuclease RelE of RelBE toxin-antitoxin system